MIHLLGLSSMNYGSGLVPIFYRKKDKERLEK